MKSFTRAISNIIKSQPYQTGRYFDKDNIMVLNELGDTFYYDKTTGDCTLRVNGISTVLPAGAEITDEMFTSMNGQLINQKILLLNSVLEGEIHVTALSVTEDWDGEINPNNMFNFTGTKPTLLLDDRYSANNDVDAVVFYCIEKNECYFLAKRLFSENFEKEHLLFTIDKELYDSPDRISFSFNTEYAGMYHVKKDDAVVTPPDTESTPIETWPPEVVSPVILLTDISDSPLTVTIQFEGGKAEVDFGDGSEVKSYTDSVEYTYNDPNTSFTVSVTPQSRINTLATDIRTLTDWGSAGSINRFKFLNMSPMVPTSLPNWITDASYMFYGCRGFNQDISGWDTSNITDMNHMLYQCSNLNANLDNWDTSNVTNMSNMFVECYGNIGTLENWNTEKVKDFSHMFHNAGAASNINPSRWNTSNATNMSYMFAGDGSSHRFNADLSAWDTSKVTDMSSMFDSCSYLFSKNTEVGYWSLEKWDVGQVTTMKRMFYDCFEGVPS